MTLIPDDFEFYDDSYMHKDTIAFIKENGWEVEIDSLKYPKGYFWFED